MVIGKYPHGELLMWITCVISDNRLGRYVQLMSVVQIGSGSGVMSRHVSAAGTRFRLLNCGMSLLQGDVLPKTLSKHTLRQRIYSCSLDFFCADKMYPVGKDP